MRQQNQAYRLFIVTLLGISFFSVGCKINKMHCGAFYTPVEPKKDSVNNRNFIVKHDGTKIYGNKISYKSGLVVKNQINIDGQKFNINETKGYQANGVYYHRLGNGEYIQRIVHGRLNVYYKQYYTTSYNDKKNYLESKMRCLHYIQQGDNGRLFIIANQKDIKKYVYDCPLSMAMISKSNAKIRKAIRRDYQYLNKIFEYYNAGNCNIEK